MDDDDTSFNSLLYCDEDPFGSTPPPPAPEQQQQGSPDDEVMEYYKAKQRLYAPQRDYCCYLQQHLHLQQQQQSLQHGLAAARLKAVRYIIYAMGRLGLKAGTAFNAVNYLDRFLSINCHLGREEWMVEVVSVACLSLACKLDEVAIPSLHDLQMEEVMGHSFRASTIGDMELTLLKALRWRLACATPFSFLQLIATAAASSRCTALLLRSLLDPSFLRFDASLLAASALTCIAVQPRHLASHVHRLIHPLCQTDNEVEECFNMMKALYLDLSNNPGRSSDQLWSPISVIPFQTDGTVNRSAVSRCLFGGLKPDQSDDNTKEDKGSGICTCVQEMK